jgi:hypothetical protein
MSMVGEKGDEEGEEGATTMAAVAAAKVVVAAAGQYSCWLLLLRWGGCILNRFEADEESGRGGGGGCRDSACVAAASGVAGKEDEDEEEEEEEAGEVAIDDWSISRRADDGSASSGVTPIDLNQPIRAPIFRIFVSTAKSRRCRRYNMMHEVVFAPIPVNDVRNERTRASGQSVRSKRGSSVTEPICLRTSWSNFRIIRLLRR